MEYENKVLFGNSLEVLKELPSDTFDSYVSDIPYGLGSKEPTPEEIAAYLLGAADLVTGDFMGKKWNIPSIAVWKEVFRVLKPGAHLLSFGGTRTFDLISLGIRMAGFANRDTIAEDHPALRWVQGQGMPHSYNVSKGIDKSAGAVRKVVGQYKVSGNALTPTKLKGGTFGVGVPNSPSGFLDITIPATAEAELHDGEGTALKPSWEPILVFKKPFKGPIVKNVLKYGTGGLNIDGCRVRSGQEHFRSTVTGRTGGAVVGSDTRSDAAMGMFQPGKAFEPTNHQGGRWPPNGVMVHAPQCLKTGTEKHKAPVLNRFDDGAKPFGNGAGHPYTSTRTGDENGEEDIDTWDCIEGCPVLAMGDPSKYNPQFQLCPVDVPFFYTAKASKKEATLDGKIHNDHPTKKPLKLMQWLVRLVTPKGGLVLDSFCGSGTTLHAAVEEGMRYTGIDNWDHAVQIATRRMELVHEKVDDLKFQQDMFAYMESLDGD